MTAVVSWKLFWVSLGFSVTLAAGALSVRFDVNPWIVAAATPLAVVIAILVARSGIEFSDLFDETTAAVRSDLVGLISLAVIAHAAWLVTFQFTPRWWPWWWLVLLVAAVLEYGSALAWEYVQAAKARRRPPDGGNPDRQLDDTERVMAEALRRAGLGTLAIVGWRGLRDSDRD